MSVYQLHKIFKARVVFWKEFDIQNTFTIEITFMGSDISSDMNGYHFNLNHYLYFGKQFCLTLLDTKNDLKIQEAMTYLENISSQKPKKNKKKRKRKITHNNIPEIQLVL